LAITLWFFLENISREIAKNKEKENNQGVE
jgi:hypothetical protein